MNTQFGVRFACRGVRDGAFYHPTQVRRASGRHPVTYGHGEKMVEVRKEQFAGNDEVLKGERWDKSYLERVEIGVNAREGLIRLSIAEIVVADGLSVEMTQKALKLYGEQNINLEAGRGRQGLINGLAGIGGFLTTDDMECASYVETMTSRFSPRLDGEMGLVVSKEKLQGTQFTLDLRSGGVAALFAKLGQTIPSSNDPENTNLCFQRMRIFNDSARFDDVMYVPMEFISV